jgi:hypothetical protein
MTGTMVIITQRLVLLILKRVWVPLSHKRRLYS